VDAKGRLRWHRNDELARQLQMLYDILVIGGYDESHARRYPQLAYTISRHHECIDAIKDEGRLTEIPGIGVKTVGTFYRDHGIDSLEALKQAIENGTISGIKGIGEKLIGNMERAIAEKLG